MNFICIFISSPINKYKIWNIAKDDTHTKFGELRANIADFQFLGLKNRQLTMIKTRKKEIISRNLIPKPLRGLDNY